MTKKFKTKKHSIEFDVLSPEEALAWLDSKGIKYEICDTPIPIMGNKASCGVPKDIGDEMIEGYFYLPKSVVGLHPLVDIPAQGPDGTVQPLCLQRSAKIPGCQPGFVI